MEKVKFVCSFCNVEQEIQLNSFKKKKTPYCRSCVPKAMQEGVRRPNSCRENNKRWKGGEYISTDGYKMIKVEDEYCESGRQKYKKEHILIYEEFLGRELQTERGGKGNRGEQLHHVDGNKLNNLIDNLAYCSNPREHMLLHCQLEEIAFELVRSGLIQFNKENNKYYIDKSFDYASTTNN
jgi:hypothetical protein